ncbi:MAG: VOC family protein, partial [Caulobacteraceae bacterium]|nr:VOC family protein [Caulobacteraceae bacterium]
MTVAAASLTAPDVERAARFYESVFGFSEIRRIDARAEFLEIVLKPGATSSAARATTGA